MKNRIFFKIISGLLSLLMVLYLGVCLIPTPHNFQGENPMMKDGSLPILIAHGGGNKEFPDNTLEAFYNAYSVDPNVMMETDVSITKDGVVILSHDTTLDRKTNATGAIIDWNYTDLISEKVDFGYTNQAEDDDYELGEVRHFTNEAGDMVYPRDVKMNLPEGILRDDEIFLATRLEDLLICFPNNRINVEIKQSGKVGIDALKEIIRLVEKYDAYDRVVLASFHTELYEQFKTMKEIGRVPENFMFSPGTAGVVKYYLLQTLRLDSLFSDKICVLQLPTEELGVRMATERIVNNAHAHNIAVHYWTVNDEDEMRYLIELGVDGIMTDYPHRLQKVLDEYR
jgi:glycerophosphoryl diester phosphodiesterase